MIEGFLSEGLKTTDPFDAASMVREGEELVVLCEDVDVAAGDELFLEGLESSEEVFGVVEVNGEGEVGEEEDFLGEYADFVDDVVERAGAEGGAGANVRVLAEFAFMGAAAGGFD